MNSKLNSLAMSGLILLFGTVVNAAENHSSFKVLLGSKSLDSNWGKDDSMDTIGFQSTYQPASLPFGIALDFFGSGNESKIGGNTTETTVGEINLGLRYQPTMLAGAFLPYLGAGVSYVSVELEEYSSGVKRHYEDTGIGYWIGGGIDYVFAQQWSIGIDARYSSADVELNGETRDAGGIGWGANIGYRF